MPYQQIYDSKQNPLNDGTGYNEFPHGWREITEAEFSQSRFFSHAPDYVESRQMMGQGKPVVSATLYWMWDRTGFSIVQDFWAKRVKFFMFGCEHKMETQPDGDELCVKCAFHHGRFDTSD